MSLHHVDRLDAYAFAGFPLGLYLFYKGFRDLNLERLLGATPKSKVRSMAMGLVELRGQAKASGSLADPVYGQPCVYFDIVVKEERGSGKEREWVTILENSSALPFYLADETGQVLVYPQGATLYCDAKINCTVGGLGGLFGAGDSPIDVYARALNRGSSRLSIEAHIVREGEPILVLGTAAADEAAAQGPTFEEAVRQLKADPVRMKALDKNGDGRVDPEEWDEGVRQLRAQLAQERLAHPAPPPPIAVRKGDGSPFVIADKPPEQLVSRLEWASAAQIVGGPALALACAVWIAHSFGYF